MISALIVCHLIGDFLLQNHWMQRKGVDSFVCAVHVTAYILPFCALLAVGFIPLWMLLAIFVEHFLQDRFQLHVKWMGWYGQTTPAMWPAGPLFVDQSMHIAFMGILVAVHHYL